MDDLQEQYKQLLQRAVDSGRYPAPVVVYRGCVANVFRFKFDDRCSEWWVVEVDETGAATAVKRICNY